MEKEKEHTMSVYPAVPILLFVLVLLYLLAVASRSPSMALTLEKKWAENLFSLTDESSSLSSC